MRSSFLAALSVVLAVAAAPPGADARQQQPPPGTSAQPAQTGEPAQDEPSRARERRSRRTSRPSRRTPPLTAEAAAGSRDDQRLPRDPGPIRSELSLAASVLGGYDDNLTRGLGPGVGMGRTAMASGSSLFADATLGYLRGNRDRSIRLGSTGTLQHYPKYLDRPAAGGSGAVEAMTSIGRGASVRASERVGYDPFFNVFQQAGGAPPGVEQGSPGAELYERRSLNSTSAASLDRRWGDANATTLSYSYRLQRFTDGDRGDSDAHTAGASHRLRLSSSTTARASYRYVDRQYSAWRAGDERRIREHRVEAGPEIATDLSRRRSLHLSLLGGATRVEAPGYETWLPTGSADLTLGLTPDCALQAAYRRDFSLLGGVTDEVYTTDTASVSLNGPVGWRASFRLAGTYANWKTPAASGLDETLDVWGGSMQLQVALTRALALTGSYHYYYHRYSDPGALPPGFPAEFDRHAVRAGLTLLLPLAGDVARRPPM
jgi:hypothetical protein